MKSIYVQALETNDGDCLNASWQAKDDNPQALDRMASWQAKDDNPQALDRMASWQARDDNPQALDYLS
jgi:hypothetical protein